MSDDTGQANLSSAIAAEQLRDLRESRPTRSRIERTKAISEFFQTLLLGGAVALVLLVLAGLAVMAVMAVRSRSVVIDSFDAPPALAASGINGKTAAADVLDAFTRVQTALRAATAKREVRNAWTQEIAIEVPKTGLSVGQINRLFKSWLSDDTHVGGTLVMTAPGRVALTVRGTAIPAKRFEGSIADLPALATRAAEYLFGEAEPALMGVYLNQQGRHADAVAFISAKIGGVDDAQRARMLGEWSNALDVLGRSAEAIDKLRAALRIDPAAFARWDHLTYLIYPVAGAEAAVRESRRVVAAYDAAPAGRRPPEIEIQNSLIRLNMVQRLSRATLEDSKRTQGGSSLSDNRTHLFENAVLLHDYDTAQRLQAQLDLPPREMRAAILALAADRRADSGDKAGAIPLYERARSLSADDAKRTVYAERLATMLAETGRGAQARAIVASLPADPDFYVRLSRLRAETDDPPATDRAYRALVASAPSVPDAWLQWGHARLAMREYRRAEQAFLRTTMLTPDWADGWEGCGQARAALGDWTGAADCYAKALERAPAWPALAARLAAVQALTPLSFSASRR